MRFLFAFALTLSLCSCVSTYRKQSEPEIVNQLPDAQIYTYLDGVELKTYFDTISWDGNGPNLIANLTLAAIGAYVESDTLSYYQDAVEQLKGKVTPELLQQKYISQLPQLQSHIRGISSESYRTLEHPYSARNIPKLDPGEVALVLTPYFGITDSKLKIQVDLEAVILKQTQDSSSAKEIYRNRFIAQSKNLDLISAFRSDEEKAELRASILKKYQSLSIDEQSLEKNYTERDQALANVEKPISPDEYLVRQLAHWMHNDGKYLEEQLNLGINETFKLLAYDLQSEFNPQDFKDNRVETIRDGRQWVRLALPNRVGTLASVPKGQALEWSQNHSVVTYISF